MCVAELGDVGEDADRVVADLHEAAVHGDVEDGAVGERDARVVLRERTEERGVAGQEGDLAATQRAGDHLRGLAGEERPSRVTPTRPCIVAMIGLRDLFGERLGLGQHLLDAADVEERLLGHVVEVAAEDRLEALDGLGRPARSRRRRR